MNTDTNRFRNKIILILLTLISISIIINNLILLKNYTPLGYEIDVYSQQPMIFWYGLSIVYFCGCILVLQEKKNFKIIGIVILLINYCTVLLIPYELGYYSYGRGDTLEHIGWIKDLTSTGHTDPLNIYPATHIFVGMASLISGANPNTLALLLPCLLSILFVLGVFIFIRDLTNSYNRDILYLTFSVSLIYYFGWLHFTIIPNFLFFILIPLMLFVLSKYLKNRRFSISATLLIFLFIIPFGHIFVVLFMLYIFFLIIVRDFLNKKVVNSNPFIILLCTFVAWFIYNAKYIKSFGSMYHAFITSLTKPVMTEGLEKMSKINLQGIELIKFVLLYYGRYLIPLFFVLILIIYLIKNLSLKKKALPKKNYTLGTTKDKESIKKEGINSVSKLIIMLGLFGLFQLFLLFNTFLSHNPHRMFDLNYIIFVLIPLFAISLYELIFKNIKKIRAIIVTSFILTSVFTLSLFGAFDSPYIQHANQQATYNEVVGTGWLLTNKDEKPIYDMSGGFGKRFSPLFLGRTEKEKRKDILGCARVQDHFGYDENKYFNETNRYIVITTVGELLYQTVYKRVGRYNASDFEKFRNDPHVIKIYDSLDIEIYKS